MTATIRDKPATPSEKLIAAAREPVTVTDETGRTLVLREPDVLAQYDLVEAIGPERAMNGAYVAMTMPVIYVAAINGDPVGCPQTFPEVRALISRLGSKGMKALMETFQEHFAQGDDPEAEKNAVKK